MHTMKGLSMIELLIAVVIIGVLSSVAYPAYQDYVTRANRADGYAKVNEIIQAQERFFSDQVTYTANLTDLAYPTAGNVASAEGHYLVTAAACGGGTIGDCVVLTAVPQASQTADGNLTIDSRGAKTGNW